MDNSFFVYLQRLELIAFFPGYALIYVFIQFIAGNQTVKKVFKVNPVSLLPFAYALVGTLYLGLQIKNLHPDYSIEHAQEIFLSPFLIAWGILAILFWIPALAKKPTWSLFHSLVFFFLFAKDLFLHLTSTAADKSIVQNNMKLFTDSLLLNGGSLLVILLMSHLLFRVKGKIPKA